MDSPTTIVVGKADESQFFFRGCSNIVCESPEINELLTALLEAQKLVQPPQKDSTAEVKGKAKGSGKDYCYEYKFTAGEDMLAAGRQAFLAADLLWSMCGWEIRADGPLVYLDGYFELAHPKSKQFRIYKFPMPINGTNTPDKNLAGTQTYLIAKATRAVLSIPQEEEHQPDRRTSEPERQSGHHQEPPREATRTVTPANGNGKHEPQGDNADEGQRKALNAWWRRLGKVNEKLGGDKLKWNFWCCDVLAEKGLPEPINRVVNVATSDQADALLEWLKEEVPKLEEAAKKETEVVPVEEPPEGEGYYPEQEGEGEQS